MMFFVRHITFAIGIEKFQLYFFWMYHCFKFFDSWDALHTDIYYNDLDLYFLNLNCSIIIKIPLIIKSDT